MPFLHLQVTITFAIKNFQLFFPKQAHFLYCKYGTRLNGLAASFDDDPLLFLWQHQETLLIASPGGKAVQESQRLLASPSSLAARRVLL